jgi:hypothetical protein
MIGPAMDFSRRAFDERLISIAAPPCAIVEESCTPMGFVIGGRITISVAARESFRVGGAVCLGQRSARLLRSACLTEFRRFDPWP